MAYEIYGTFPDVILDCVGAKVILPQILELAGKTTTVVIVGNYSEPVLIDVATIQRNELNVLGNITYTAEDFQKAVELMVSGKVYTCLLYTSQIQTWRYRQEVYHGKTRSESPGKSSDKALW